MLYFSFNFYDVQIVTYIKYITYIKIKINMSIGYNNIYLYLNLNFILIIYDLR